MNIFEQYGIKEVADVCLYSIELDENDDEIYVPVLYLDTLKVSTIEETAEQTSARGGLGNPELIIWDYGKEITVNLEDALYSPASQGMTWGGKHGTKPFRLDGVFEDDPHNVARTKAKADFVVESFDSFSFTGSGHRYYQWKTNGYIVDKLGRKYYVKDQTIVYDNTNKEWLFGLPGQANNKIFHMNGIGSFSIENSNNARSVPPQEVIYQIDHALNNVHFLDRMEKCIATQTFCINTDTNTLHGNYRYLQQYSQCELTVFIDPRTMQPYEPNTDYFERKNGKDPLRGNLRIIKQHEIYYKWTRSKAIDNTSLGHQIIVDAIHFPGTYRLVGETYSRSRKTGKDQRYQFEIPLCKMGTENNLTLQADGDPTTFNMTLKVLRREDGVMMKLTQFDVAPAKYDGYTSDSTVVVPGDEVVPTTPEETGVV